MAGTTATTRKRAARKATTPKARATSATRAVLNLDTLTKDEAFPGLNLPTEPFGFILGGHSYELRDPRDSDWKMAWQLANNPFLLMRTALVGADDPIDDPTAEELAAARERIERAPKLIDVEDEEDGEEDGGDTVKTVVDLGEPTTEPILIDRFTATDLPGWKLNALFENWHTYYKIDLSNGKGILGALLGKAE